MPLTKSDSNNILFWQEVNAILDGIRGRGVLSGFEKSVPGTGMTFTILKPGTFRYDSVSYPIGVDAIIEVPPAPSAPNKRRDLVTIEKYAPLRIIHGFKPTAQSPVSLSVDVSPGEFIDADGFRRIGLDPLFVTFSANTHATLPRLDIIQAGSVPFTYDTPEGLVFSGTKVSVGSSRLNITGITGSDSDRAVSSLNLETPDYVVDFDNFQVTSTEEAGSSDASRLFCVGFIENNAAPSAAGNRWEGMAIHSAGNTTTFVVYAARFDNGSYVKSSGFLLPGINTPFYVRIKRVGTTLTIGFATSASNRDSNNFDFGSVSLSLPSAQSYSRFLHAGGHGQSGGETHFVTAFISDLKLNGFVQAKEGTTSVRAALDAGFVKIADVDTPPNSENITQAAITDQRGTMLLRLTPGTPAASNENPPDIPANSILLYQVVVGSDVTIIGSGDVLDSRVFVVLAV